VALALNQHRTTQGKAVCRFCIGHEKGLCQAVDLQDAERFSALNAARSTVRVYDAGDLIYAQGDASEHLFNLLSGWVAVYRDLRDGRRHVIKILLPGAVFGIEPTGARFGHGAVALTNASVCPIRWGRFAELRAADPALNEHFIRMLERETRRDVETLTVLAQGSARERIAMLLHDLIVIAADGAPVDAGAAFRMPLTQRLIGEATGLTPIHVNRILRQMREERIAEFGHGGLTVINPAKLRALAAAAADVDVGSGGFDAAGEPRTDAWARSAHRAEDLAGGTDARRAC
jgi:CRP/FNR family transcriptional regulator, anaerobic regulatory protein